MRDVRHAAKRGLPRVAFGLIRLLPRRLVSARQFEARTREAPEEWLWWNTPSVEGERKNA
jgi:hypothetical protein